jgi:hypothetical protein
MSLRRIQTVLYIFNINRGAWGPLDKTLNSLSEGSEFDSQSDLCAGLSASPRQNFGNVKNMRPPLWIGVHVKL